MTQFLENFAKLLDEEVSLIVANIIGAIFNDNLMKKSWQTIKKKKVGPQ